MGETERKKNTDEEVRYMTEKEKNKEIQIQYNTLLIDYEKCKKECKALDNDKYELEIKLDDAEFFLKDAESKMKECTKILQLLKVNIIKHWMMWKRVKKNSASSSFISNSYL